MASEEQYLKDTVGLLIDAARSAARAQVTDGARDEFQVGRAFGLMEAVSLLHQQMSTFGLEPARYGFPKGFDPERELVK